MKKLICIILVALMLLACVPFTALGAVSSTDVCKIGDTGYATLDAAIDAVKNGQTIVLLKNATLSKLNQNAINYTIDGQNKAYTIDVKGTSSGYYINIGSANITFKNVKVNLGSSGNQSVIQSDTNKTGDITFNGCEVKAYSNSFYKLNGRGNFTLINSTWDKMSGNATAFYFRGDHADVTADQCVITVENSTITNHAGQKGQTANNNIFHLNSSAGSTFKFNFKGNTVLKNASKTAGATGVCIMYNQQPNATMIINCDPTVEFIMAAESTAITNAQFIYTGTNAVTVLYGAPKLTTTASVASQGIYMPVVNSAYAQDGTAVYTKWNNGSTQLAHGAKYTGSATSFTPVADASYTDGKVAFRKNAKGQNLGYYDTLDAAVSAAKDGDTILLIKNATISAFNSNAINYTIDGQNKAYTIEFAKANIYTKNANTTFKNAKINMGNSGQTIIHNGKDTTGDLTFEGCEIKAYQNSFYRLDGRGNFTLRNSSWDKMTGNATAFYSRGFNSVTANDECNFTVENSTITNYAGSPSQLQNNCVFHWNSYDNGNVKIHLKGNTVIKNASTVSNATVACLFYNERSNASMKIYSDPTVQLILAPTSTSMANAYFVYTTPGTPNTILYGIPQLKTTEALAAKGVYMPLVNAAYSADGKTAYHRWSDGTNQYDHGVKYTGSATSFTPVASNDKEAYIKNIVGLPRAYYATLDGAIAAVNNNETVVLVKDASLSALKQDAINYTIDGQNQAYTIKTAAGTIDIGEANVTFKNAKIDMGLNGQSILQNNTSKTGDVIFNGCHIRTYKNSFYKLNGKGNFTMINSTWDKMSGDATVFYFRGDHAVVADNECVITLDNSTINNYAGNYWQIQNNCIFHLNSSAGTRVKFYFKGNSVLNNASETANLESACIFYNEQPKSTIIINAEPTVKFQMNAKVTAKKNIYFIYSNPSAAFKIVGTPNFVVSDSIAAQGFKFFNDGASITYGSTDLLLGFKGTYTAGGEVFVSDTVEAGKITKGFSVQPVTFGADDFDMLDGAAIRTQDGSGIRFSTNISNDLLAVLGDRGSFGTLIAQNNLLTNSGKSFTFDVLGGDSVIALKIPSTVAKWQDNGDTKQFRAALIGVPDAAKAYTTRFAARAYMTVTYDDGTTETFYTDFGKENLRSMYDVAVNLNDASSAVLNHIKNTVTDAGISVSPAQMPTKSIDLYLIAGQSNAAGTTIFNESTLASLWPNYKTGVDNVKLFGYCEQTIPSWTNAKAGQGGSTSKIGPEAGMAAVLANYYTGNNYAGIIKHTYGGTSLFNNTTSYNAIKGNWVSPSYAEAKGYDYSGLTGGLYRGLIEEVEAGIALLKQQGYDEINVKGIFWMQGESDRSNPTEYETAFTYFVNDLRSDLTEAVGEDLSDLPIMVGEISRTTASATADSVAINEAFINMQRGLASKINNLYVIASGQYEINWLENGENKNGQDAWHWLTEPMFRIGEMVGNCIVENMIAPDDQQKETYGSLTLNAPSKIYTNYPAISIETVFSKPEMAETLTFATNNANVKVENGKIYATGTTATPYTVTVTARSENFLATAVVTVETYQGATASGSSLNLETQITTRKNQITSQSVGNAENLEDMVLFVGDSFFNPDNWWTSFYTDYAKMKAYTVGISSSTAEDWQIVSERLVYPYNPKAVVLHIGTNDIFDDKLNAADTTARLQTLLNTYHEKMPNTKIYWFNIEPRVGQSFAVPEAVNANMAEFAKGKDWLVVIDSASWCFTSGAVDSTFFKDGIHPANEKYALYREALVDAGLIFNNKIGTVDGNSFPDVIRDKAQGVNTSAKVTYNGQPLVNEYVVTGTLTITDVGSNPHAQFQFRDYKYRFLIWDRYDDSFFGVGWANQSTTNDEGYEEYAFGSSPLVLDWKVVFTEKNAYFYVEGVLKAVFYNVPSPSNFDIATEAMTATHTNIRVYTKTEDSAIYNEALAAVSSYEAKAGTTTRVERVG